MTTSVEMIPYLEYAHPHIALKIKMMWGLPECDQYINKLLLPTRIDREGFDEPTIQVLVAMQELHGKLYPTDHDVWEAA